ncbi:hypothetical protein BLOT_007743 [Blomia tropicalis]|nr:hypothetical protein BLOT_007743 [Blomia tropicalis]
MKYNDILYAMGTTLSRIESDPNPTTAVVLKNEQTVTGNANTQMPAVGSETSDNNNTCGSVDYGPVTDTTESEQSMSQ